ncbi:hypothetical protein B0H13DRAFT_2332854 [Mycena leptocephala]|nr:hypothetical protein B0H13DRAFT_2332854 [Mycena leptocephala]
MAKTKTATTLFMEKNFPAPPITPCPHGFFHVQSAYQAAKCDSDPARFGQYTTTCIPPKDATAAQKKLKCRTEYGPLPSKELQDLLRPQLAKVKADKRKAPVARPKKKTALQIALNAVVAAFTDAFPDGVRKPLTHEKGQKIDDALSILNAFYEAPTSAPSAKKGKPKADIAGPSKNGKSKVVDNEGSTSPETRKGKSKAVDNEESTSSGAASLRALTRRKFSEDEAAYIQADEYDSDIYDIEPTERKSLWASVKIVIFNTADQDPLVQDVRLRSKSNFNFKYFNLAKAVNAVPDGDNDPEKCAKFLRYSLSKMRFTADRVLGTLNLTGRGNTVIYRAESLSHQQCPGLDKWINRACSSAFPDGYPWVDDLDEDDDDDDDFALDYPSTPIAGPSSTPSTSSARKRKLTTGISPYMDGETDMLHAEDQEHRAMRKFTRDLEEDEVVFVADSDDE